MPFYSFRELIERRKHPPHYYNPEIRDVCCQYRSTASSTIRSCGIAINHMRAGSVRRREGVRVLLAYAPKMQDELLQISNSGASESIRIHCFLRFDRWNWKSDYQKGTTLSTTSSDGFCDSVVRTDDPPRKDRNGCRAGKKRTSRHFQLTSLLRDCSRLFATGSTCCRRDISSWVLLYFLTTGCMSFKMHKFVSFWSKFGFALTRRHHWETGWAEYWLLTATRRVAGLWSFMGHVITLHKRLMIASLSSLLLHPHKSQFSKQWKATWEPQEQPDTFFLTITESDFVPVFSRPIEPSIECLTADPTMRKNHQYDGVTITTLVLLWATCTSLKLYENLLSTSHSFFVF